MRALTLLAAAVALGALWLAAPSSADGEAPADSAPAPRLVPRGLDALFRPWLPTGDEPYELDEIARFVEPRGPLPCPSEAIVAYRGTSLRYARTVYVHRAFIPRLAKLEEVIAAQATAVYGRAPRRLLHRGAYNCRRARGRPERLSEHALGNAVDVAGFTFGPLRRGERAPAGLPRHLARSFQVRIDRHWSPRRERDALHARFLHALADALHERPDVIRGIVGPPARRHHDHLHLDAAPWRYGWYAYDEEPSP
jgi:hypothetical protein